MTLFVLGVNYKTASVAIREKVSFTEAQLPDALQALCQQQGLDEVMLLSTCNRTEIYGRASTEKIEALSAWLSEYHQVAHHELRQSLYLYTQQQAISHTMRVACGLDSMVLGEPQILGQMKKAFQLARTQKATHSQLERLFQHTFAVAKQVRTDTAIGQSAVSVAFAAVRLAQHIFSKLSKLTVLLIGAGETIELVARHLSEHGVQRIIVANRTLSRAQHIAQPLNAETIELEYMPDALPKADIVISSTGSQLPIVGKGMMERAIKLRRHRTVLMIDLAVPRDIEPQVADMSDVYLYTVDDLQDIIQENLKSRQQAAQEAELIIQQELLKFQSWLNALQSVDSIRQFRQHVDQIKQQVEQKALADLQRGVAAEDVIQSMAHLLANRFMHQPSVAIRSAAEQGQTDPARWIAQLFDLPQSK